MAHKTLVSIRPIIGSISCGSRCISARRSARWRQRARIPLSRPVPCRCCPGSAYARIAKAHGSQPCVRRARNGVSGWRRRGRFLLLAWKFGSMRMMPRRGPLRCRFMCSTTADIGSAATRPPMSPPEAGYPVGKRALSRDVGSISRWKTLPVSKLHCRMRPQPTSMITSCKVVRLCRARDTRA